MALPGAVESLDDVPEQLRDHYVEGDNGYRLAVDGWDDATELKDTLGKVRRELKEVKTKYRTFEGFNAEDLAELDELRELREQYESAKGDADAALTAQRERLEKKYAKEVGKLAEERDGLSGRLTEVLRDGEAIKAISDAGGIVEALLHHVTTRASFDADFKVVAEGLEGEEVTIPELVAQMKDSGKFDWGFRANGGAGGGADGRKGRAGSSATVRKRADLQTSAAKAAYISEHGREAYLALPE